MNIQKHLLYITNIIIKNLNNHKIKAVNSQWKEDIETVSLSFYFDEEPTEEELEDASIACAEIIAQFPTGFLEENYFYVKPSESLPKNEFWAYKRSI